MVAKNHHKYFDIFRAIAFQENCSIFVQPNFKKDTITSSVADCKNDTQAIAQLSFSLLFFTVVAILRCPAIIVANELLLSRNDIEISLRFLTLFFYFEHSTVYCSFSTRLWLAKNVNGMCDVSCFYDCNFGVSALLRGAAKLLGHGKGM